MKKLTKILFYFGIVCLFLLLLQDFLFFRYVKTFNNLEYSLYLKIDRFIQNSVIFLLLPAAYVVFRLLKVDEWKSKIKLIFYFIYGAILPFFLFRAVEAGLGYLSYDHTSFSAITWARLNLKIVLTTVAVFYIFPILASFMVLVRNKHKAEKLRQFGLTVAISLGSAVLALVIAVSIQTQINNLLNRLMLDNKVESTLPKFSNVKNQEIVIADYPKPVIDCYLKQNPGDLTARILNLMGGTSFWDQLGYNTFYFNDRCFVVYLGTPLILTKGTDPTSAVLLSEFLIRHFYGAWIQLNADKRPARTVVMRGEEAFKKNIERGKYDSDTNVITLQWGYSQVFETITHELIHSFAPAHISPIGNFESGLGEAITQHLTAGIMNHVAGSYRLSMYDYHVHAFEKLLTYVDEGKVREAYFNGALQSLQKEVDNKTYAGAYCRFTGYLDRSIVEYNQTKNFQLAKEYAMKATRALEKKEKDDLNCF